MKKLNVLVGISLTCMLIIPKNEYIKVYAATKEGLKYFTASDSKINNFSSGDVDIEIEETFTPPADWNGKEAAKKVSIKNNSKSPALIRVSIVPRWVDNGGNPWSGNVSSDVVNIKYSNIDSWIDGKDGYYYYNKIVPTSTETKDIISSVTVTPPDNLKSVYKGKKLIVDVKSEAIQATKDAYTSAFRNIKDENIKKMLDDLCAR